MTFKSRLCPASIYNKPQKISEQLSMKNTFARKTPDIYLRVEKDTKVEYVRLDGHYYSKQRSCKLVTDYFKGKVYDAGDQIVLRPAYVVKYSLYKYNPVMERLMKVLYCNKKRNDMALLIPKKENQAVLADEEGNNYLLSKFAGYHNFQKFIYSILMQEKLEKHSKIYFRSSYNTDYCSTELTTKNIDVADKKLSMFKLIINTPLKFKFGSFTEAYLRSLDKNVNKFMEIQKKILDLSLSLLANKTKFFKNPVKDSYISVDGEVKPLYIKYYSSEIDLLKTPYFALDLRLFLSKSKPKGAKTQPGTTMAYSYCIFQYYDLYRQAFFEKSEVKEFFIKTKEYLDLIMVSPDTFVAEYSKFGEYLNGLKSELGARSEALRQQNNENKLVALYSNEHIDEAKQVAIEWTNFFSNKHVTKVVIGGLILIISLMK